MSMCPHGRVRAYCGPCTQDALDREFLSTKAYHEEVARRATSQGPHGRSFVVEIITDPADTRGLDAKPIRRAA
jgi:hypothetical protein